MVLVWFKPDLWRPTGFLQCFDTVGLVIWPVKIVPEMTYYVSSGTLNPTHSLVTHWLAVTFQVILMQALPNFLLTCMDVMSTTELCDVIIYLLASKPRHLSPDLSVAWLRCMKHLAKSACFSPPGNNNIQGGPKTVSRYWSVSKSLHT